MDNPIIERDVVLIGKTEEGNDTFDLPVTRLGNIEEGAETKAAFEEGDFLPIIDMKDNGKMKKTPYVKEENRSVSYTEAGQVAQLKSGEKLSEALGKLAKAVKELIAHIGDNVRHITASERDNWNGKAAGSHSHTAAEVGALTNIKIGTVTTGAAGSQAAASASTSGTVTTLNFTIPKGDKGDKGAKGDTGAQGLKGDKGDTGAQGLKGDKGDKGDTGAQGPKGDKGDKGDTGPQGPSGATASVATKTSNGLMSAEDKKKLDGISGGAKMESGEIEYKGGYNSGTETKTLSFKPDILFLTYYDNCCVIPSSRGSYRAHFLNITADVVFTSNSVTITARFTQDSELEYVAIKF